MTYTTEDFLKMIKEYKINKMGYIAIQQQYESETYTGAKSPAYGEEAAMPKGSGTSDPVFETVKKLLRQNKVAEKYLQRTKLIEDNLHVVEEKQHESTVLALRLSGKSTQFIADNLGVHRTNIDNTLKYVATLMKDEVNIR